jgi:hypothetical protein
LDVTQNIARLGSQQDILLFQSIVSMGCSGVAASGWMLSKSVDAKLDDWTEQLLSHLPSLSAVILYKLKVT